MLSTETTYSKARAELASLLDEVYDNRQVVVIKRRNQKNVALIAEEDLASLLESVHLLRSPENAQRLFQALDWSYQIEGEGESLDQLRQELGLGSQKSQ
ncbi:type II toxin-antitoxin system Phd/YefM family antitoxin [Synechocystis sp. LKSZ1]|uniref:type II toxin-antitoxin system Phd/YefM family antitoxin n=1 Tax=Synechocystis sp. LKSZ1 TaxID=3144951 RepID=UPI00336C28F6